MHFEKQFGLLSKPKPKEKRWYTCCTQKSESIPPPTLGLIRVNASNARGKYSGAQRPSKQSTYGSGQATAGGKYRAKKCARTRSLKA